MITAARLLGRTGRQPTEDGHDRPDGDWRCRTAVAVLGRCAGTAAVILGPLMVGMILYVPVA